MNRRWWWCGLLLLGCAKPTTPVAAPEPPAISVEVAAAPVQPKAPDSPFELEADFRLLTLADFESFAAESTTWKAAGDAIECTGKPKGYLYTNDSFQNFTWRFEYRFPRPASLVDETKFKGNTGFLVYITGEHKLWPMCLEVQGKHVQMGTVKENGGATAPVLDDHDDVRQSVRHAVGAWNQLEVSSRDGELSVRLNDQVVCRSQPVFLSAGPIGIQAEDHPFEVRRMRIRVDP